MLTYKRLNDSYQIYINYIYYCITMSDCRSRARIKCLIENQY